MNDLKVFSNSEFGELGIMLIDGKEYFPATQCAKILGYASPKDAITRHCKGAIKRRLPTAGGEQDIKFIPEGDLYRLIVSSKLPAAEEFERWVFDEVLPSIRQTGGYGDINIEQVIAKTATAVVSEVVKQLVPVLTKAVYSEPEDFEVMLEEKPRKRHRKSCIITKLSAELRGNIDDMLYRGCSYKDVVNYLEANGVKISQTAVSRYYNNYYLS